MPAFPQLWTHLDDQVGHLRRYTRHSLREALEGANFVVERLRYQDCLGCLATLALKRVGPKDTRVSPRAVRLYDAIVSPLSRYLDVLAAPFFGKSLLAEAVRR